MPLSIGTKLGPYEVTAKLGEGGMGEVYRATDTRLKRDVAIKVLPEAFTADKERLARFEREAQLLAQLHHSNIASIFGLEEKDGVRALVMELVDGPTLAERLERGPLAIDEALSIAHQIAEALEEAHEKGIVHRDLKPANIKLTADGKVKVLDFGLAKAMDPVGGATTSASQLSKSPTLIHAGTQLGMILGTAAYMAPEQARGTAVDKRADIWAFGVVLYEMLSGTALFAGETVSDTLASVLKNEIDFGQLPAATPTAVRQLLRRCLERKPKNRLHDIADARIVIDDLLAGRSDTQDAVAATHDHPQHAARGTAWPMRLVWLAAGLALGALTVVALRGILFSTPTYRPPLVRTLTYSGGSEWPSISADGKNVAFQSDRDGTSRIWLKQLATGEEVALTEGPDRQPRISPDSSSVLFLRAADDGTDLFRVPLVGGESRRLARNVISADWSPDGKRVVFARNESDASRLIVISSDGGTEQVIVKREGRLDSVTWSPDGTRVLMYEAGRVNTIATTVLVAVEIASGTTRELFRMPASSRFSTAIWDGNDAVLYAFSPSQAGGGQVLLQRLTIGSPTPQSLFSFPSLPVRIGLAGPGSLVFDTVSNRQNLFEVAANGTIGRALTGGPTTDRQPAFSPDGRRVVFTSDRSGNLDLWSIELSTRAVRRLTFDVADDWDPHWSIDGKHLLWSSNRGGHFEVWMAEPDGAGAQQVTSNGVDAENPGLSADGAWIVYSSANPAAPGIWKARPDGRDATHLLRGAYSLPELSPRTNWVAASVNDGSSDNQARIHIVRLEDGAVIADVIVPGLPRNAGRSRWMPDGKTLVFYGADKLRGQALFRQPIVPGVNTNAQRELLLGSDDKLQVESFAVSQVDGRVFVSSGWSETDVLMADGIPGIGASLPKREP